MSAYPHSNLRFIAREGQGTRTPERLRAHYEVERRLADKIRAAGSWEARKAVFSTMYDDLFREVPDHPRRTGMRADSAAREKHIDWNMAQLKPYLQPGMTFLEIGAGDCALASRVARTAKQVYAVDIS